MKMAYTVDEAVKVSGIGRTKLYAYMSRGELSAKKLGARTLILAPVLEKFLAGLPDVEADHEMDDDA